eukprot:6263597-Prymnesium_polylepis.1
MAGSRVRASMFRCPTRIQPRPTRFCARNRLRCTQSSNHAKCIQLIPAVWVLLQTVRDEG